MFPANHSTTGFRSPTRFDLRRAIASLVGWGIMVLLCPCMGQTPSAAGMPNRTDSAGTKVIFYQPQELEPYVSYLHDHAQPPIQYLLRLFHTYDLVILAERTHPETTQWEFIYELTSHPEFIASVGHIFTEYGSVSQQKALEEVLNAPNLEESALQQKLIGLLRDFPLWPYGWHNNNIFDYLKKLYHLNRTLPVEDRIALHFSDVPWQWEGKTPQDYARYWRTEIPRRDQIMADQIAARFQAIRQSSSSRTKALVIMNTRHAFKTGGNNTADFLFQAFPDKTANVMLNMTALDFGGLSGEYQGTYNRPIHDGLWDAAFWRLGDVSVGFDFAGSPFGRDLFDLHTYFTLSGNLRYEDVFTGLVFCRPLGRHMVASSIPGYYDDAFKEKVVRRARLMRAEDGRRIEEFIRTLPQETQPQPLQKEYWRAKDDPHPWCRLEFKIGPRPVPSPPASGQSPAHEVMAPGDPKSTEPLPSGVDILERCLQRIGGREKLAGIRNRSVRGTVEIKPAGLKGLLAVHQVRPNRHHAQIDVAGQITIRQGTDGAVVWELNPMTGPRIMEGQEKAFLLSQYVFDETRYRETYDNLQCLGIDLVEGQSCYKVVQSLKPAMPITVYYSKETGLPMKACYTIPGAGGAQNVEITMADYRPVDGILYAHRTVQKVGNVETLTLIESIQHNVVMDPRQFDLPEGIRAVVNKEEKTPR
ncbi:MAG: hypothetical protein MUC88_26290 [Planctomycetes bacterium]|jgi:hypothetical protein|nr:hypothetical protein [Planctomycetota bacterium]